MFSTDHVKMISEVKMEDVFEEYRKRLLDKDVDILILEIFETFAGTDYIDNTLDLVQILEGKDYKEILQELKAIRGNIYNNITNKYTGNEKLGYSNIADGYIRRVESRIHKEKDVKDVLLENAQEILTQENLDIEKANKWIKQYIKYIKQNYKSCNRDYKLLTSCIIDIQNYTDEVTKILLKKSIELANKLLKYYL